MESKRKKVLLLAVSKSAAIGGQAACARMLLKNLKGVEWHSISFPLAKEHNRFFRFLSSVLILFRSLWICLTKRIEALHVLTACGRAALFEKLIIIRVLKMTGVKTILNFQGAIDIYYSGFSERDQRAIKRLLKSVDVVLCLHDEAKKYLVTKGIVPTEKIQVIPNAVEIEALHERTDSIAGEMRLSYLGWVMTNKGIVTLVKAAGELVRLLPEQKFTVSITGPQQEEGLIGRLKAQAASDGTEGLISFHQPVSGEAKKKFFSSTDIFVFPSRMEGFPFVLLEAMQQGLAVITTDIPPMNIAVRHESTGLLFEKDNHVDLAGKIKELITNSALRNQLGVQARNHVIKNYSVEKIIDQYSEMYSNI